MQDRIASLNGASVEHVLRQDRAAFMRLIGRSIVQVPPHNIDSIQHVLIWLVCSLVAHPCHVRDILVLVWMNVSWLQL
jgi:hypothetical protein